ncbi:translation initiation factor eIF-2B [candidate division CSSED10-310 bacterium]|uniref:Translation initiation factor eIF-2B n=1 Tax=candidate division CSSED10-310 bacterium TaxID=2855610 RepID=A0ABV6Z161_UNCC1
MSDNIALLITESIETIKSDNTSGAHALTAYSGEILRKIISNLPPDTDSVEIVEIIARVGLQIIKAQPAMAPLRQMIKALLRDLEEPPRALDLRGQAIKFIERYLNWLRDVKYRIAMQAAPLISENTTILTHSLSTLVFETFRAAKAQKKNFVVIATEARPVYEGRLLCRQLSEFNVPVTLVVDAAGPSSVEKADLVFFGADRITQSEFINKIGTLAIVLAAHRSQVPCYVLAGSDKYLAESDEPISLHTGKYMEVWEQAPAGVTVSNPYFERIPLRLITGIISEAGVISYGQFAQQQGPFFQLNGKR